VSGIRFADGLQAERTAMAWTRTSLAVLANGALLLLKAPHTYAGRWQLAVAAFGVLIGLATCAVGVRRNRVLLRRPLPRRITARREIPLLGVATIVLCALTAVVLVI
jgi:uncharacterized membrane protein YidH (DUF202 family)